MRSILYVIPHESFFPPANGGQLRTCHLLKELGRHYKVHALVLQDPAQLRDESTGFVFPPTIEFHSGYDSTPPRCIFDFLPGRLRDALLYRWLRRSPKGPAQQILLKTFHIVRRILEEYPIEAAVFEHAASLSLSPLVGRLSPKTIRILDAHNIDHRLIREELESAGKDPAISRLYHVIKDTETHLNLTVDGFFACSDADREELVAMNGGAVEGFTVPNGVDTTAKEFDTREDKRTSKAMLFCGSLDYEPNIDGLSWFHEEIWPLVRAKNPGIRLTVIGQRNRKAKRLEPLESDSSIDVVGTVPDVGPHYRETSVAVVPLRIGSGTRLKILEAMSFGNPVVSTTRGAEGIAAEHGVDFLLADSPEDFADAVTALLTDEKSFRATQLAARETAEKLYDWGVAGDCAAKAIETLMSAGNS